MHRTDAPHTNDPLKPPLDALPVPEGCFLSALFSFGTGDISLLSLKLISSVKLRSSWVEGMVLIQHPQRRRQSANKVLRKHSYCLGRALYFMPRWKLTCLWTRLRPKKGNKGRKTCRDMLNIYSALPTASAWLDPPQYMLACPTLWGNMLWFTIWDCKCWFFLWFSICLSIDDNAKFIITSHCPIIMSA